jgi:serine/threonine protein kinase
MLTNGHVTLLYWLQMCSHPNIVNYMNSIQTDEALWIIMEYCGGGSITDVIASNGLPLEESTIAYICSEALKGLSYLHKMNKVLFTAPDARL